MWDEKWAAPLTLIVVSEYMALEVSKGAAL